MIMNYRTREDQVAEFNKKFSHPVDENWGLDLLQLRLKLLDEELEELKVEVNSVSLDIARGRKPSTNLKANLLKELCDLQYVLSGMAVALGLPVQEAFNRVHASNMSKLDEDGNPIYREDGKVMKGPNYKPPYLEDLVS